MKVFVYAIVVMLAAAPAAAVDRVAGWGRGDGALATEGYVEPYGMTAAGDTLYLADGRGNEVRRLDSGTHRLERVAGTSQQGFAGDGGPAVAARLSYPLDVAVGGDGTVYTSDGLNGRIRAIAPGGTIRTIAAALNIPAGLDIGPDGRLYVADTQNNRVVRIGPLPCAGGQSSCSVELVAGTGAWDFGGDGGPATLARFRFPQDVRWSNGALYVADTGNNRIRRIASTGTITTVAGNGNTTVGPLGDGGPATAARVNAPRQVAVGPDGTLFIAETDGNRVRAVGPDGIIHTVLGTGASGPPVSLPSDPLALAISQPIGVALAGNVLYVGSEVDRIVYTFALATMVPGVATPTATATRVSLGCDATGNGTISALDATRILQFVAGLRSDCPVRTPTPTPAP